MLIAASVATALVAARTDARERTIPNWCCVVLACLGLAFQLARALIPGVVGRLAWEREVAALLPDPVVCVVAAAVLLVLGVALELGYRRVFGKAGMGFGDVKYLAAWATLIGPSVLLVLAAACLAGAAFAMASLRSSWRGFSCS